MSSTASRESGVVLLGVDATFVRGLLRGHLRTAGFSTVEVRSGAEARAALEAGRMRAALLLEAPRLEQRDWRELLGERPELALVVVGPADPDRALRLLLASRDGELLRNPFDFRLTLRAVRRVQRGGGIRRAS